jgi:hypothetical protein
VPPNLKQAPSAGVSASMVIALLVFLCSPRLHATIGLAEWQVATPGGNRILHLDPLKDRYGTCLVGGSGDNGQALESAEVLVAHIRWWQFYRTYVAGETDSGFFLFDEVSRRVDWYDNIEALRTHARQRSQDGPRSAVMEGPVLPVHPIAR